MFVMRNEVNLTYFISMKRVLILLKFYREIDEEHEGSGGGDDNEGEEVEDGEQLPPESDSDKSEDEG